MNALFVCNAGINRSRTAAELWQKAHPKDEVKYTGILGVDADLLRWAGKIVCFEEWQKKRILEKVFGDLKVYLKLQLWEIPDIYNYMDEKLVEILSKKIGEESGKQ